MHFRAYGTAVLLVAAAFLGAGGTERERPILGASPGATKALEAAVAAAPSDPTATRALAQRYLDLGLPGLAVTLLRGAPAAVRDEVQARHVFARALIDEGRNGEALDAEQRVVAACRPVADGERAPEGCDSTLLASALRRASILRELLSLGVEDAPAHPETALVAYQNATRDARLTLE